MAQGPFLRDCPLPPECQCFPCVLWGENGIEESGAHEVTVQNQYPPIEQAARTTLPLAGWCVCPSRTADIQTQCLPYPSTPRSLWVPGLSPGGRCKNSPVPEPGLWDNTLHACTEIQPAGEMPVQLYTFRPRLTRTHTQTHGYKHIQLHTYEQLPHTQRSRSTMHFPYLF